MIGLLSQLAPQEKIELIYKEYDVYPHHVESIGKVLRLYTQRGSFALKKTSVDPQQLEELHITLHKLQEKGVPYILPPLRNKYGDSFVPIQQDCYYLTPWIEEKVEEKYRDDWEKNILRALGHLHRVSAKLIDQEGFQHSLSPKKLVQRWNKRLLQMSEYKKFAQDRELMSPVETVFLNQFEYLNELSLRAINYLKEWENRAVQQEKTKTVLCHGHIYRNHILHHKKNQLIFISFDYSRMDSPARDLALFFRRHLDKAFEFEGEALKWLEAYESEFPLEKEDKILLAIYLLFPERVFKEMDLYYQAARDLDPLKHARFLEKQINYTYAIRHFVKDMLR